MKSSRRNLVLVSALLKWFEANARDLPWRRTSDPYAIWVSEIMLQQTQVKTVIPYWERWMRSLPDIRALAEASPELIHKLWEGLGYYTRVRNMQSAAREILARHAGTFPREHAAILELPGIGRYTAGAIASIAFNEPQPILDGNVMRVLTRVFGIAENPREKSTNQELWRLAEQLVITAATKPKPSDISISQPVKADGRVGRVTPCAPSAILTKPGARGATRPTIQETDNRCSHLNQSLMELGALICTPRQPKCAMCPLRAECVAFRTGRVEQIPNLAARATATARYVSAFVAEHHGKFLVRQRPAGQVNAHLWEFPNGETPSEDFDPVKLAREILGFKPTGVTELCVIKHTITRYRITLRVFRADPSASHKLNPKSVWLSHDELNQLAFTSAHRRILQIIQKTGKTADEA